MNTNYNPAAEVEIDLIDLMWKLLMQWKAILIVCIITALLVPGAKYIKDRKAYSAALEEQKQAEEESSRPAAERIEEALEPLSETDRSVIRILLQQEEMAALQEDYLNNSISLNTDPTSQRSLTIKYLLSTDSGTSMQTLADSYATCIRRNSFKNQLREIIAPESKTEYINELISTYTSAIPDSYADSTIFTVSIVIPEDTDADKVSALVDSTIESLQGELEQKIGYHTIEKANTEDCHSYNKDLVDRRTNIINTINSLNASVKNTKAAFTEEQAAAFEVIEAIQKAEKEDEENAAEKAAAEAKSSSKSADSADAEGAEDGELVAPRFSKKYALLGLFLGAFLYAGLYVVVLILRRSVASASAASGVTGTRLLGEIYTEADRTGLAKLLMSERVKKWRYGSKLDRDVQVNRIAASIDAICAHHQADRLTLLMSGIDKDLTDTVDRLAVRCRNFGADKHVRVLSADAMEEKEYSVVKNAVYVISDRSKLDDIARLTGLCKDYEVTPFGSVYMEEL